MIKKEKSDHPDTISKPMIKKEKSDHPEIISNRFLMSKLVYYIVIGGLDY